MSVVLNTKHVYHIRNDSAYCKADLLDLDGNSSVECFFEYRIKGSITWSNTISVKETFYSTGEFIGFISSLVEKQIYEVRAVAFWVDSFARYAYGNIIEFECVWLNESLEEDFKNGIIENLVNDYLFEFTGAVESVSLPPGTYLIELWGAQGGAQTTTGKGGYAKGTITLETTTILYFYVGGTPGGTTGGWNGGGNGNSGYGFGGGGASDVRIGGTTLYDRILVAAGGGGRSAAGVSGKIGGHGGGLIGDNGGVGTASGGTQTAGGATNGVFGFGGNFVTAYSGGGGAGWFGGGGGSGDIFYPGAGGSSYIGGTQTIDTHEFPKVIITDGTTQTGINANRGKIKVTCIPFSFLIDKKLFLGRRQIPYKGPLGNSVISWDSSFLSGTNTVDFEAQVQGTTAITNEAVGTGDGVTPVFYLDHWPANTPTITVNAVAETGFTLGTDRRKITFDANPADTHAILASYTAVNDPVEAVEIQELDLDAPTGGTFKLGDGTTWTADIAYDATAATIETALEGLYGVRNVKVIMIGSGAPTIYSVDQTATMSANTIPFPNVMAASSQWGDGNQAHDACDKNTGTHWISTVAGVVPCWISYSFDFFGSSSYIKTIRRYSIQANPPWAPNTWIFQGYTGTSWVTLCSESGIVFATGETKIFDVPPHNGYYAYRIYITINNGGTYTGITELKLYEAVRYTIEVFTITFALSVGNSGLTSDFTGLL